jgi:hypothetical protein
MTLSGGVSMDQPNSGVERVAEKPFPWWVRSLFPQGIAQRRYVLRNFWIYAGISTLLGIVFGLGAFLPGSDLHPYRWWVLGVFRLRRAGWLRRVAGDPVD